MTRRGTALLLLACAVGGFVVTWCVFVTLEWWSGRAAG